MNCVGTGVEFSLFGAVHLTWLVVAGVLLIASFFWYRSSGEKKRKTWRITLGLLLIAEELVKTIYLLLRGKYQLQDLPLELCSINLFLIFFHAVWNFPFLGNFLYTFCIPGALAALLFPGWTHFPIGSFLHVHGFSVHILLLLYPAVLALNGEILVNCKRLFQSIIALCALVAIIYLVNLKLGTNFMFLMEATQGNPLFWFDKEFGSHLWGFIIIGIPIVLLLYLPVIVRKRY